MGWYLEDAAGNEYALDVESESLKLYSVAQKFSPSEALLTIPRMAPVMVG